MKQEKAIKMNGHIWIQLHAPIALLYKQCHNFPSTFFKERLVAYYEL